MAYANKWQITANYAPTGSTVTVYIQERDYSGSIIPLETGSPPALIEYLPIGKHGGFPWWNLASNSCTVSFYDDPSGKLSEILDGDDEQFKLLVYFGGDFEYVGFITQDSYRYSLYSNSINTISATDRIDQLYDIGYVKSDNTNYVGRATIIEILSRCLDSTGLELGFATHVNWYPYLSSNNLTSSDDVLANLRLDQDAFFDDDGNPYSKGDILEQVLLGFQCRLYQVGGRWMIHQRKKSIIDVSGTEYFTCFHYDKDGVAEGTPTANYLAYQEVSFSSSTDNQILNATASGTAPIGEASRIYLHGNPFDGIMSNLSFEENMRATIDGTILVDGIQGPEFETAMDGFAASETVPEGVPFTIAGDDQVFKSSELQGASVGGNLTVKHDPKRLFTTTDNAAVTFYEDQGGWHNPSGLFTLADEGEGDSDDDVRALQVPVDFDVSAGLSYDTYVRQTSAGDFAGGAGTKLKTGWKIIVPGIDAISSGFKHAFKIYVTGSSTWYYKHSDTTWTTTDTLNEVDLLGKGFNTWSPLNITTAELLDGSTPITGPLTIEFWEGKEIDPGSGSQNVFEYYIDNVIEPIIVLSDGSPSNEATQTLLTYTGNVNRYKPPAPALIFGDGPTAGHISRLTVLDSTGAEQELTSNWSFLPNSANSGFSLDQFGANQWIREFGKMNKVIDGAIWSKASSNPPRPYHQFKIKSAASDTEDVYDWTNYFALNLASHKDLIRTSFTQFQERLIADQLCSVDIKPSSQLLAGIDINQGIVCDGTEDFNPNISPTHVYFSNSDKIKKAAILDSGSYTIETIKSSITTGRSIDEIRVDEGDGWIFVKETVDSSTDDRYLVRYKIDGTDQNDIVSWTSSPTYKLAAFALARQSSKIYCMEVTVATNGYRVTRRDYDGTLEATLFTDSDHVAGAQGHGIAVSSDETYIFFRSKSGTNDNFYRHQISNGAEVDIHDITDNPVNGYDNGHDGYAVDSDVANGIFININENLATIPYPAGGSQSSIGTTTVQTNDIALDRSKQKFYTITAAGTDDIQVSNYDGSSPTTVIEDTESITSLDLGFN